MPTQSESTSINLQNDITVTNAQGQPRVFKAGQAIEVPRAQAEDLLRMDHEANEYQRNLHTKRTSQTNMGSMSVGGE